MYGAIIGDIVGSIYEFRNIRKKEFEFFTSKNFFTDDSVMTVAVADSILNNIPYEVSFRKYGKKYPNAGYGGSFGYWLRNESEGPYDSYGNGSAMRVSPAGWIYDTIEETLEGAKKTAECTHNHPEGIKGAQSTAAAIFMARNGKTKEEIKSYIETNFGYDLDRKVDDIRPTYSFNETCQRTVPEAIIAFLESTSFEDAIRTGISLGGDSDTLAAITGSISEAFYGIPDELISKTNSYLNSELLLVINAFYDKFIFRKQPTEKVIMQTIFTKDKIFIKKGDITEEDVDCIVNSANPTLLGGGGVDGQIHLKAGNELYKECNYLRETEYPNGIEEGMVVLTIGYKLKAKYILHAHAPVCHKYKDDSWMKVMESTYQVCLDLADEKGLKSITFPFLGAGIFCCDREKSAKIALNIAKEYIINNQNSGIEKITFILWREKDYELFESINK